MGTNVEDRIREIVREELLARTNVAPTYHTSSNVNDPPPPVRVPAPELQNFYGAAPLPKVTQIEMLVCPKCGGDARRQEAGISKAGKPYKAFYSCRDRACNATWHDEGDYGK